MKLYAFYPNGYGPLSFFVMAVSEAQARGRVEKWVRDNSPHGWEEWPLEYTMEVAGLGEVLTNDNN